MPDSGSKRPRAEPASRIEDYRIVSACDTAKLRRRVLKFIDLGWEPVGGVCFASLAETADAISEALIGVELVVSGDHCTEAKSP